MATPLWVEHEGGGLTWGDFVDSSYWTDVNNPGPQVWDDGSNSFIASPLRVETRPTTGEIVTETNLNNVTSEFWRNRFPPGTHWTTAAQEVTRLGGQRLLTDYNTAGQFAQFPSFTDPADWARIQQKLGTDQNQGGVWGSSPAEYLGLNTAAWQDQNDSAARQQDFQVLKIAASALTAGALSAYGAEGAAAAEGSAEFGTYGSTGLETGAGTGGGLAGLDQYAYYGTPSDVPLNAPHAPYTGSEGAPPPTPPPSGDWWTKFLETIGIGAGTGYTLNELYDDPESPPGGYDPNDPNPPPDPNDDPTPPYDDWGWGNPSPDDTPGTPGMPNPNLFRNPDGSYNWPRLLGTMGPAALGAYASNRQSQKLEDLAGKYMEFGAPSRARYEGSFDPSFTMMSDPGYKGALDDTTKAFLHKASIAGNPADSPNAWQQTLSDVNAKFAYPALQDYRRTNLGAGGLAALTSAAPGLDTGAVNAQRGIYDAIGGGIADVFNPPRRLEDLLREMRRAGY